MGIVDPDLLHFIVLASLTREELLRQIQGLGFVIPGVRHSRLNRSELADALVEAYGRTPSAASEIGRTLDIKLPAPPLPQIHTRQEFKAYKKSLRDLRPEEMSAHLWWLSKAEGPGNARALQAAIGVLESRLEDVDRLAARDTLEAVIERSEQAEHLEKALEDSRRAERHQEKKVEELSGQLDDHRKKLQYQARELAGAQQTLRQLQVQLDEKKHLQEQVQRAEQQSGELSQARAQIELLERELLSAREKLARCGQLKRVGLFADIQNLIITAQELYGGELDFRALRDRIEEGPDRAGRVVTEAYAYLAEDPVHEKTHLKSQLREAGFSIQTRPILYRADGSSKGDWDLGMAIAVLDRVDRLDVVVLGTGDGDFLDLVLYLKDRKPHLHVEIACFDSRRHTSDQLLQAADYVHRLGRRLVLRNEVVKPALGRSNSNEESPLIK